MTDLARIPVIVGVGQALERDEVVSVHTLLERAARAALVDASGIESHLDGVWVVNILNRPGPAPAGRLARRLRLRDVQTLTTTVGGNSPNWLLLRAADAVASGELDAVLVAGGEAMRSGRAIGKGAKPPRDADSDEGLAPDQVLGTERSGLSDVELNAGLAMPAHVYPMIDSVLAARAGRGFAEHRQLLGRLMAPFTEVAAKHPYAWFPEAASPAELSEPTDTNRLTAEPYTKRLNAFLGVDQSAAFIVTSAATAAATGLAGQAVAVWSGASCNDVWFTSERPDLGSSAAIAAAGQATLEAAGIGLDDVGMFDLYSCFPSAVELGGTALGLAFDDPRGLTLTGGLPYFGGPGNNYPAHAIATAVERLRERGGLALTTGLGWYATKHTVTLLGAEPPPGGYRHPDLDDVQAAIDATTRPASATLAGRATVVASTVIHGRDGRVESVPVIAESADDVRTVARARADLDAFAGVNLVGAVVELAGDGTFELVAEP